MYRRTKKSIIRRRWKPEELPESEQRQAHWQPPVLRRRIVIEDFDGPESQTHVIELFRTPRIDSYRAVVNGKEWNPRIGWSRVLDGLRRALPRLASSRWQDA